MFDFTREINLDQKNYSRYRKWQAILYLLALALTIYFSILILFPNRIYSFSFSDPNSQDNSIEKPLIEKETFPEDKKIKSGDNLYFYASPSGDFSNIEIIADLNKAVSQNSSLSVYARKSYKKFLLDESGKIGFKDGSLFKNSNNFYIISEEKLRKFSNISILKNLGYSPEKFLEVSADELKYNMPGEDIASASDYPQSAIFKIEDNYYILKNENLIPFTSENAFLSQYDNSEVLEKNSDFLKNYSVSEDKIGFADGSLVSNGDSAYIISAEKIYPIDNAITFEAKGFSWGDVIPAGTDEVQQYEKTKLFNINDAHPDGIIFMTVENRRYFLIKDGKKYSLPSENIANSWLKKRHPISVSQDSENTNEKCVLRKSFWPISSYFCEMPTEKIQAMPGLDYEFKLRTEENIEVNSVKANFNKNINKSNLKSSLLNIFNRIKLNYVK